MEESYTVHFFFNIELVLLKSKKKKEKKDYRSTLFTQSFKST